MGCPMFDQRLKRERDGVIRSRAALGLRPGAGV